MDKKALYQLLRVIATRSSIGALIQMGYRSSQIVKLIDIAREDDYLEKIDENIKITVKGIKFINDYMPEEEKHGSERWIMPQKEYYVTAIQKYDIFLPRRF